MNKWLIIERHVKSKGKLKPNMKGTERSPYRNINITIYIPYIFATG